jgi:hypothetical protein
LVHILGNLERGQTPCQLAFATNVGLGEMTTASRGIHAKVMGVKTEETQGMIGTDASGMVQGVQSEMESITMAIKVGSQGMIDTGNREESGDGRGRGQWMQEMTETKSDVEWVDNPFAYPSILGSVGPILIKPRLTLSALGFW